MLSSTISVVCEIQDIIKGVHIKAIFFLTQSGILVTKALQRMSTPRRMALDLVLNMALFCSENGSFDEDDDDAHTTCVHR